MSKQKNKLNKLVLSVAGIFVVFYVLAIVDAIKGTELPGVIINSDRQIGYQRWDTSVLVDDGKKFETFKTLQSQTGDAITVTKNGESYRFGSKSFLLFKSFLWICYTILFLTLMKRDYIFKNIRVDKISKKNIPGMSLTLLFILLIFFMGF